MLATVLVHVICVLSRGAHDACNAEAACHQQSSGGAPLTPRPLKALVSDADGTLVDTVSLIRYGQFQAALDYIEKNRPDLVPPTYLRYKEALDKAVGGTTHETFARTMGILYADQVKDLEIQAIDNSLQGVQDRLATDHVRAFPGLASLLRVLGQSKVPLAIMTSGSRYHVLRNFGIALRSEIGEEISMLHKREGATLQSLLDEVMRRFGARVIVIASDDVEKSKPDPAGILLALQRLEVEPSDAVMVGDQRVDMIAGKAAGVTAVGLSHGFDSQAMLEQGGASAVCRNLSELQMLLGLPTEL